MLFDTLQHDLSQAQLARDEQKTSTLRLLLSEIKNAQIAKGSGLTDDEIISVIQKEVKKRKEAASGFRQGGREESAKNEETEAEILSAYLPAQMSDGDLAKIVEESIKETGATVISDMGKVMANVMGKVKGQADGARISVLVKERLGGGK